MKSITLTKQMIWKIYFILVLIFTGSIGVFAETEPNNSRETANSFGLNSSMSGSFTQADGSSDYYKLVTTSDGKLEFTLTSDQALCVDLVVVSETGQYNLYYNGYCSSGSHTNKITINNLTAGTYYLWADRTGYGNYTITNTFVASGLPNDAEPNDSRETAVIFPVNSEKTGHLGYKMLYADADDYYKVSTSVDGKFKVQIVADASLCVDLTLVSENGMYNLFSNGYCSSGNHLDSLVVNNLAAGIYYIRASNNGYGSYKLTNTLKPASLANDTEPNNSRGTAIALTTNTSVTGHLGYKLLDTDDKDYYKIVTTGNLNLSVAVTSDPGLCVELNLQNSDGTANLANNGYCGNANYKNKLEKNALPAGTYYIVASPSGYGSYRLTTSYTFVSGSQLLEEDQLMVYPNPARQQLFLNLGSISVNHIRIFNLCGNLVFTEKVSAQTTHYQLDISNFQSGIYLVECQNQEGKQYSKFIKE
ncbi:MAG: T9SS type A sorting domain-containing protein [Prolixibacteraceae bacterium]|nr:T9SS type A sorting domain-containing protein [Prolixibacteraceae bacterium]